MRNHFSKLALTATLGFALTFTFSCSTDYGGFQPSSSSYSLAGGSSSSVAIASSSSSSNGISSSSSEGASFSSESEVVSSNSVAYDISSSSSESDVPSSNSVVPSSSSVSTLACASVPSTGTHNMAITPPTVICNGAVVSGGFNWTGAPDWNDPVSGTYSGISVSANYGDCSGKTATCSGTLTVNALPSKGNEITNYRTVQIGTQTWMAENLDYDVSGSKCGNSNSGSLSDANTATCITYGRLYNWATAMALPSNCNSSTCSSQIQPQHQGICPSGWHIPSEAEWDVLINYVGGSSTAGTKLKATSGWGTYLDLDKIEKDNNGTDIYGFSALPGGDGISGGNPSFSGLGSGGHWWSSSEYYYYNANSAHSADVLFNFENGADSKDRLYSVRCLQNTHNVLSKGNDIANYRTVQIGAQTWMAENLDYDVSGSKCPDNRESKCITYGRLYDWATAMGIDAKYNGQEWGGSDVKHRGICPSGWHIPSDADWNVLMKFINPSCTGSPYCSNAIRCSSCDAGTKLKATSGWNWENISGNGTDEYGFAALPAGAGYGHSDGFIGFGSNGYWWSSSSELNGISDTKSDANIWSMDYKPDDIYRARMPKGYLLSVRCLQD